MMTRKSSTWSASSSRASRMRLSTLGSTVARSLRNYRACYESIGTRHRLRPDLQPHRRAKSMKRVLVAEDVECNRDLVVQLLEDTYEVLTAVDGVEGLRMAEQAHPDLILMDLSLPVINGWEVTRRLKA